MVSFESDNLDEAKFGSKLSSDNRNVKNLMSGFKMRAKNSCLYLIFFESDKFGYSVRTNFCQHYFRWRSGRWKYWYFFFTMINRATHWNPISGQQLIGPIDLERGRRHLEAKASLKSTQILLLQVKLGRGRLGMRDGAKALKGPIYFAAKWENSKQTMIVFLLLMFTSLLELKYISSLGL